MSVWATFWAADGADHTDGCRIWRKRDGVWEMGHPRSCSCGQPSAPIRYQGSHVLPDDGDQRGGSVQLALVPSHITRDGRDDQPDNGRPYPYVRVSVGAEDAILDEQGAAAMHRALGDWLLSRQRTGAVSPGG